MRRIQNISHNQGKGGPSRQESLGDNWIPGLKRCQNFLSFFPLVSTSLPVD